MARIGLVLVFPLLFIVPILFDYIIKNVPQWMIVVLFSSIALIVLLAKLITEKMEYKK